MDICLFLAFFYEKDEKVIREFDILKNVIQEWWYKRYEISNFSKKGYESKHNLVYWNNEEYYGFGLGASGYTNNIRYKHIRTYFFMFLLFFCLKKK